MTALEEPTPLAELLRTCRILICCGGGGVGKTTTAAALGMAAARAGRKVLVLTIDPARRLAQALGIPENSPAPVPLPEPLRAQAGITGPGSMDGWVLSPALVFEGLVRRLSPSEQIAARILETQLFKSLCELVAGMQEYTAAEAVYEMATEGRYELIVLDTPPSRHALDFLDAPGRLSRFLDERILSLFMPGTRRFVLLQKAAERVSDVLTRIFGPDFFGQIQEFLTASKMLFGSMRLHADQVRALLSSRDCAFVLVTTTEEPSVTEAAFFRDKLDAMRLPFAGVILNRSWALGELSSPRSGGAGSSALQKLEALAERERAWAKRDGDSLDTLRRTLAAGGFAVAAPHLGDELEDGQGLARLSAAFA